MASCLHPGRTKQNQGHYSEQFILLSATEDYSSKFKYGSVAMGSDTPAVRFG